MITHSEGLTDKEHLAKVMVDHTSLVVSYHLAIEIIDQYLERCVEVYENQDLVGYVLIFNVNGERSMHGFKLIEGHSLEAYRIAKLYADQYAGIVITTTVDKVMVTKLANMLGFEPTVCAWNVVKFERVK